MKVLENWDLIDEAGELKSLPAGPQICRIIEVIDVPEKEYLDVYFDILEGEYANYFTTLFNATGKNYGRITRSYKSTAVTFFKQFIKAIEKSNPGYKWNWDEKSLTNKTCVVVFRDEEYIKDGQIKVNAKADEIRSLEALREGKIQVKPIKKLEVQPTAPAAPVEIPDEELPF